MRIVRNAVAVIAVGLVVGSPTAAVANGGAYVEFDETYYAPGDEAVAEAYVSVPPEKRGLLARGPFWLYALPAGTELVPGRPIPVGAVRLAPLEIGDEDDGWYELVATFTMPELAPGDRVVGMCDEPCTLNGFGEPLTGAFTLAGSPREVELLRRNDQLSSTVGSLERQLRKAGKEAEELEFLAIEAQRERDAAAAELAELRERSTAATARSEPVRPLIDAWAAVAVAAGLSALVVALVVRHRSRAVVVAASLAVATVLIGAPTASAGGSWLELRDVAGAGQVSDGPWGGWAAPGSTVTMRGTFGSGAQAPPSHGPWIARLRADVGQVAVPLGPVELDLGDDAWVATVTFVVPEVPSGEYWVDVCDAATCSSGVGDLIGGTIVVAATELEGELLTTVPQLEGRVRQLEGDRRQLGGRVEELEDQLGRAEARREALLQEVRAAAARDVVADRRTAALAADLDAASADLARWRIVAFVAAAAAIATFTALMAGAARRRRFRPTIPDTPEQLLEPAARP
jgi:hypothetical protein